MTLDDNGAHLAYENELDERAGCQGFVVGGCISLALWLIGLGAFGSWRGWW